MFSIANLLTKYRTDESLPVLCFWENYQVLIMANVRVWSLGLHNSAGGRRAAVCGDIADIKKDGAFHEAYCHAIDGGPTASITCIQHDGAIRKTG